MSGLVLFGLVYLIFGAALVFERIVRTYRRLAPNLRSVPIAITAWFILTLFWPLIIVSDATRGDE